jgi:hypothetical protein
MILHGGQPPLRRHWRWRPLTLSGLARATIGVVGFIAALFGLGLVAFAYLLEQSPINLDRFKPVLLASLQERLGDHYRVSLGSTSLVRPANGFGLSFGFGGIEIDDSSGRMLLSAPGGRISLDFLALLDFRVRVRRLELDGLVVNLRVHKDGELEVAAAAREADGATLVTPNPTGQEPLGASPAALVETAIAGLAGANQPLDHVAVAQGRLRVVNEALDKTTLYEDFAVSYDRRGETADVSASARGPAGRWSASAKAAFGTHKQLVLQANDLALDDILATASKHPPFFSDMPFSFKVDAELDDLGAIASLNGGFGFGAGYFRLDDPDYEPNLVDELTGRFHWDVEAKRFAVDSLEALAGATHLKFAGAVAPPAETTPYWGIHLVSSDSLLGPERTGGPEAALDNVDFSARAFPGSGKFVVDGLKVHGPKIDGEVTAEATPDGPGAGLKLNVNANRSDLSAIFRVWPAFINPDARNWCLQHFHGGSLGSGTMKLDWSPADLLAAHEKRAVSPDSVRADFTFVGASVDVLDGLPPMTGLDTVAVLTGKTFDIQSKHGEIVFPSGRRLQVGDVFFKVPDTAPAPIVAGEASAHVSGAADAVAELLNQDSIRRFAGFAVDPANVKGQAQAQLSIALAMGKKARPEDQKFHVAGSMSGLQLDKYVGNEKFEQGALDVDADSAAMRITGQGLLNGVPTKVEISKGATDEGALGLTMTLDDALRAKFGMVFGPPVTGPMVVKLKAPLGARGSADADVDLTKTDIANFDGASLKPAGKPGKATFSLKSGPDGVAVSAIAVDAGSLMARGTAQFGSDGAMQNIKLSQMKFAAADDFKLDILGGPICKATVRGASVDVRALIKAFLGKEGGGGAIKDLDLDAKITAANGFGGESLSQAEFNMSKRGGVIRGVSATGKLGRGALSASKSESGVLEARAADAGAMARFLDLYGRIDGGSIQLTIRDEPDGGHGHATLTNFVLRNETALRRMASAVGTRQNDGRGETTQVTGEADNVRFDKMTADFVRSGGRIDVSQALVYNATEGITLQGALDFARDKVDLSGTFVPAYGVNSLVTGIPLVGTLLGGGANEGIFAVNFRVSGAASAPTLTFNPLSGVTPGILRKIFGAFDGTNSGPAPAFPPELK